MESELPLVAQAQRNAARIGFEYASEVATGRLLAVLAGAVAHGGAVLELGTGTGVGTAWIVAGLGGRDDVRVVTVDVDESVSRVAGENEWPPWVEFVVGDAVELLPTLGGFDLVFADAPAGKWAGLERTIAALRPGGFLVVDDMTAQDWWPEEHRAHNEGVRATLVGHSELTACELHCSTGLILCSRRRKPVSHDLPVLLAADLSQDEHLPTPLSRHGGDRLRT